MAATAAGIVSSCPQITTIVQAIHTPIHHVFMLMLNAHKWMNDDHELR